MLPPVRVNHLIPALITTVAKALLDAYFIKKLGLVLPGSV